jgi:hypothetical protein
MAENQTHINDRLQWRLSQAEDDIKRLLARVTALEAGAPLPADQTAEIQPATITCEESIAQHAPVQQPNPEPQTTLTPDISVGWVGGRRNNG